MQGVVDDGPISRSPVSDDGRGLKQLAPQVLAAMLQVRPSVMTGVD